MQRMKILIQGAGFGGLELATALSAEFGDGHEAALIDKTEGFVFGFSKLDVMFGKFKPSSVFHPVCDIDEPGLHFVRATIDAIDPVAKRVETDASPFEGDVLVVALGADLDPGATPGLVEGGSEFYTVAGAFALRDEPALFAGGQVVIGVTSTPFKCPPAPSETALLMHDYLSARELRTTSTISLVMPFGIPIPPSPCASSALFDAIAERGIEWVPDLMVTGLDPGAKPVRCNDDSTAP
jgi:sulfide:quinone oxidoreductase